LRHLTKEGQARRRHLFGRHYCAGWDPVYAPNGARREADVVNLGMSSMSPSERREVLRRAWSLARRILVVSARLRVETQGAIQQIKDTCRLRKLDSCVSMVVPIVRSRAPWPGQPRRKLPAVGE
jgi:hypothetical protein